MDPLAWCHKFLTSPKVKEWLKKQANKLVIIHLQSYEARVAELKKGVEKLKKSRVELQHRVDEEEDRYGRGIPPDVKEWIERVDKILFEFQQFNGDEHHKLAVFDGSYLPKPGIRFRLSKEAYDLIRKVNGLLQTEKQSMISYWLGPPSVAAFLTNIGYESFPSRDETTKKINAAMKNPSIRIIGVYGWSGVGKTTLVKEVAKEALQTSEAKMFEVVVMANVTKNPDIRKMQGQIADMLGMKLDDESDIARAARIRNRLKNEKKSTLIILDELWAKVDFNMLGIPFENDNILQEGKLDSNKLGVPFENDNILKAKLDSNELGVQFENDNIDKERKWASKGRKNSIKEGKSHGEHNLTITEDHHRAFDMMNSKKLPIAFGGKKTEETPSHCIGCKVLLISESKRILSSQMEGKEDHIFCVDVLEKKEAEAFFKRMVGVDYGNSGFDKLAAQIADKCNGLPMSIVTTAKALKNQSRSVWEDVHRKLEWQNSIGAPEFSTKLSYDLLENEELKYTFLLCARMAHDTLIADLVKYCIGLGFLQGIYTAKEARDRVYALVGRLTESGLLSHSYSSDHFTMQDIVRSAALSIASKENDVFVLTKRKLDEWPDKLERYTAISLLHCDIIEGFPSRINCPNLGFFHVHHNGHRLSIPENFFEGMKELKVLILTGIHLSPLPPSISCLTKLRMLCLEHCELGEDLSIIGELKRLRILSFSGSNIEKLPVELKKLTNLQIFDISNCSKLKEIQPNVISSLSSLEELYMRDSLIQTNQGLHTILSELRRLKQLTTLDIQIPNTDHLSNKLFFDKLYSYKIVIGDLNADLEMHFKMPEKHETSRFLAIQSKDNFDIHSQMGIKMLFDRVETLLLEDLEGVEDIFSCLNLKGFPFLKHLLIVSNANIQSLINPKDRKHLEKAFPKLEYLYLYDLKKMDKICSCELSEPSFGKLKVMKINLCGQLKNVFSVSVAKLLTVLETIEVSECNSLTEVVQSNTNEVELLNFPELRSLMLQSLSEFVGFYPISSTGERRTLFHGKVAISKLERIELSSIQIDKIWSDQISERGSHFQKLTHLDVNGCYNLEYLISFSIANSLVNLQSLFVSDCPNMECIFFKGQSSHANMKGGVFLKLKNIKLSNMKSLREIWDPESLSDLFSKLDTLIIEECHKIFKVFPRYLAGIFRSLCNLKVTNCRSMKAIFDLGGENRDVDLVKLQDVHLETLPNLEHVWKLKKDRKGILKLQKLQKIWVHDCDRLQNIFPFAVSKCLNDLECLVVSDCIGLREIIAKGEATNTGTTNSSLPFEFGKLTTIKLLELPKLASFCPGALCNFPVLNDLSINFCDKLEPFNKETEDGQRKLVLFPEMVINKLKSMQIEFWHVKSSKSYMGEGNHRRDNLEELCLSRLINIEILYSFLHRNPNLESLSLNNCFFESIVPPESYAEIANLGVVPKLKSLKLIDMPNLENLEFEPNIILERIELLILKNCPCLVTIVPSSVSLSHLTNLEVVNCNALESLMLPSTAESLGQLSTMKVINCESLREIVGNEEKKANKVHIVFKQLKTLELVSLKNLNSFCCSENCVFEFPSLEKLVVSACCKMEKFAEEVRSSTQVLPKIYIIHEKEKKRCHWEGSLNTTIQKMFKEKKYLEGMEEMSFSEHLELQKAWQDGVGKQNSWFSTLKTLKLENCEIQQCAIPSNILPSLKSLKELEVRGCNKVKVIFGMNDTEFLGTTSQLKKLTLEGLSELTHIWEKNGQGTLSFQNLQVVFVSGCKSLQSLFPVALAKSLKKLEQLEVEGCDGLLEIVGKEEDTTAGITEKFVFPQLTWLDLYNLPQLIHFCPGSFILECPTLSTLQVVECSKLKLFENVQPEDEGTSTTSINRQSLFSDVNAISNIEAFAVDWKHISVLRSRLGQLKEDLKYLNDIGLYFDVDVNEKPILPIEILEKAPNLQGMTILYCDSLELFRTQNPKIDQPGMLGELKMLALKQIWKLESIGSEDSLWLNTICEKLNKLKVLNCPNLTTLVHPTSVVPFSCLKELYISECDELEYLFTSTAAKMLMHLEEITIKECESMKKIVEGDKEETASEGTKFERLYRIDLNTLSNLECFYSGNDTLHLPSLIQVHIWQCPKMETLSQGSVLAISFRGIQASCNPYDELVFHNDLNSTIKVVLLQQVQDLSVVGDSPPLQKIWLNSELVPPRCFYNLKSLVVEGCQFLSNSILPSHLLGFLHNLEDLQVRRCNSVKTIFDHTEPTSDPFRIPLKKLILDQLPILKHVWNIEDPQGNLSLPLLKEVLVDNCKDIQSLFPASVAKDKIQILRVENCQNLVEIVAKDDAAAEEANKERIIFPSLTSLYLFNLPNLRCIYSGMCILEWPMLKGLNVLHCQMLKFFSAESQNSPDSCSEGQDSFPIDQQAVVSLKKVTPCLDFLSLCKEDAMMIEREKLHVDLPELNVLRLHHFPDKSDAFPFGFRSKVSLPSAKTLQVVDGAFKEIFPSQRPDIDCTKILSQIERLHLERLSLLKSIGLEHSWMAPFLQNLQLLQVIKCNHLTNLTRSTVSFFHLTKLIIRDCHGLKYLFTSSTAKTFRVLKKMEVTNCGSIEEIVAKGEDEGEDEIIFSKLENLTLGKLPTLESFYTGSSILNFPFLETLSFTECYSTKVFRLGDTIPEELNVKIDGLRWEADINSVIRQKFEEEEVAELV